MSANIADIVWPWRPLDRPQETDAVLIDFRHEVYCDHRETLETYARFAPGYDRCTRGDLVNLIGMDAMTATVLIAFDSNLPECVEPGLPAV